MSQTIRQLEEALGLRLLTRNTRSVSVTEAGQRLLETIAPRFDDIHAEFAQLSALRDRPAGTELGQLLPASSAGWLRHSLAARGGGGAPHCLGRNAIGSGLHDEAFLSLARKDLSGRILLGLTEDTALTDLARSLGRFKRLHPQVAVRTWVRMSLVLRALLERRELDLAIMQVFDHEVRPTDTVLFSEPLHWVKSPDMALPSAMTPPSPSQIRREASWLGRLPMTVLPPGHITVRFIHRNTIGKPAQAVRSIAVASLAESFRDLREDGSIQRQKKSMPCPFLMPLHRLRSAESNSADGPCGL